MLSAALRDFIEAKQGRFDDIILLCIGTDRATGDCLGPLVGHMLATHPSLAIYGNLKNPIHAANLMITMEKISQHHKNPLIIAIDACLGKPSQIGKLIIKEGGIAPAMAISGTLPQVGDISIVGVVNVSAGGSGGCPLAILSSTRLSLVMHIAEVITKGVFMAI